MGFVCHSLSHALHSLRNPHFAAKPLASSVLVSDSDIELRDRVSQLHITGEQEFLTLPWLQDALKLVLYTCAQISNLLPKISCTEKEKLLLEANLEDTLNLLDVCNGLKESLNDVQHYVMFVRYAACTAMDVKDASDEEMMAKLSRFHDALIKSSEFMHQKVEENSRHRAGRSKLETCSSMLRRMGEPLPEASPGSKSPASNAIFNDIYAAKVLTIFVCSVLAIALSVKPKRQLSLVHMADQPNWLEALQTLQLDVKNLTDKGIEQGKNALLKELNDVRAHTTELCKMLNKILKPDSLAAVEVDRLSISQHCENLSKEADELHRGLLVLQQHMDGVFRVLVNIRLDFLNALCHV